MNFRKLSQTLGQIRKGFAYDSFLGKTPLAQVFVSPALGTNTAVHAAVTLPTTGTTVVTTAITNPDFARNLVVKGNAAGIVAAVTIVGLDISGQSISETITANGTAAVVGNKAFASVSSITFGARTTAGDTISIGTGAKLGLLRPIAAAGDVKLVSVADVGEAPAAADATNGTVTVTTAFDGAKKVIVFYEAAVL